MAWPVRLRLAPASRHGYSLGSGEVKGQRTIAALLVALLAAALGWWLGTTTTDESAPAATVTVTVTAAAAESPAGPFPETATDPESGLTWIAVAALPAEGRETPRADRRRRAVPVRARRRRLPEPGGHPPGRESRLLPRVHRAHAGLRRPRGAEDRDRLRRRALLHRRPLRLVPEDPAVSELASVLAGELPPGVYPWESDAGEEEMRAEVEEAGDVRPPHHRRCDEQGGTPRPRRRVVRLRGLVRAQLGRVPGQPRRRPRRGARLCSGTAGTSSPAPTRRRSRSPSSSCASGRRRRRQSLAVLLRESPGEG